MATHKVTSLSKVDPTRYIEGDLFLTKRSIGILHNGKIETLVTQSEVKKEIKEIVKKELKEGK